ncbi:hypothetical protein [Methanofollis ethanolicus]|uniref:hypothetical protein n=1 Tax=Methanofollis ethanolicus TaxID=488124 RepID=UPI00082FD461|nr:hypothetical protein [Methanofollis ethanolicus]
MMEPYTFCAEMKEVKALLTYILSALGKGSTEDRILQYPPSTDEITLEAGATYEKTVTINRRLRYLCVSVPADCFLEIRNDNTTVMWFTDEAGTIELPTGYTINTITLKVQNVGSAPCRWSCRMVFA